METFRHTLIQARRCARRCAVLGAWALIALCVAAVPLRAQTAESIFKTVYGANLERVKSTPDPEDDVALAQEMLKAAETAKDNQELLALLYDHAYQLGSRHRSGYDTAATALKALIKLLPATDDKRIGSLEDELIRLLTSAARVGSVEERAAATNDLVGVLLASAERASNAENFEAAASQLRRAMAYAQRASSYSAVDVKNRLDTVMQRARLQVEIERLRETLTKTPTDAAAAERLVRIYLLELNNPSAARPFVAAIGDEAFKPVAALAVASLDELKSDDDFLTLAGWYLRESDTAVGEVKDRCLLHAKRYLSSVLQRPQLKESDRQKAVLLNGRLDANLAARKLERAGDIMRRFLPDALVALSFEPEDVTGDPKNPMVANRASKASRFANSGGAFKPGVAGQAAFFDDPKTYLQYEGPALPNPMRELTVALWIKPVRSGPVVDAQAWPGGGAYGFTIRVYDGYADFTLGIRGWQSLGTRVLHTDRWSHLVGTYDGYKQCLYLDGEPVASKVVKGDINFTKHGLRIGRSPFDGTRYYQGGVDELLILKRALSEAEVKSLFRAYGSE